MTQSIHLVVFTIEEQQYGLPLSAVERVVRAVEVSQLPKAPAIVMGVINVQGQIIPVVNLRRRFGWPERDTDPRDQFLLAHTPKRAMAIVVETVTGVADVPVEKITVAHAVAPGLEYVAGVVRLDDGLILIHDLDTFLSLDEAAGLDEALRN